MSLNLQHLNQTCSACPSQWEGVTEYGRNVYIRYRWGTLRVYMSKLPGCDPLDEVHGMLLLETECGGPFDGVLSTPDMLDITGFEVLRDEQRRTGVPGAG